MTNRKPVFALIIYWLIFLLGFIGFNAFILKTGEEIILKTRPVDPRDLFRGDYVILDYEISRPSPKSVVFKKLEVGDAVYVELVDNLDHYSAGRVFQFEPSDILFIKGQVKRVRASDVSIEYGIESYFVPEGTGREIERLLGEITVKVAIDKNGRARIKNLLHNNEVIK